MAQKQSMQRQYLQNWRKNILDKYKVKLNPRTIRELNSIYEYIANEKLAPENAKGQVDRIKKLILNLDTFQQSHQERNEGRYAGKGYRQLLIDNYIAIFRIDDTEKTVYVGTGRQICTDVARTGRAVRMKRRIVYCYTP